jgi:hypothetical protein
MKAEEIKSLKRLVADAVPEGGWDGVWCKYDDLYYLRYVKLHSLLLALI